MRRGFRHHLGKSFMMVGLMRGNLMHHLLFALTFIFVFIFPFAQRLRGRTAKRSSERTADRGTYERRSNLRHAFQDRRRLLQKLADTAEELLALVLRLEEGLVLVFVFALAEQALQPVGRSAEHKRVQPLFGYPDPDWRIGHAGPQLRVCLY